MINQEKGAKTQGENFTVKSITHTHNNRVLVERVDLRNNASTCCCCYRYTYTPIQPVSDTRLSVTKPNQ